MEMKSQIIRGNRENNNGYKLRNLERERIQKKAKKKQNELPVESMGN